MFEVAAEEVAIEALGAAVRDRCGVGSWNGLARGLAWRVVSGGDRNPRSIDALADAAEMILGSLIDEGVWTIEQTVMRCWTEYIEACPGDAEGALTAGRLDAREESARVVAEACDAVVDTLLTSTRRAT